MGNLNLGTQTKDKINQEMNAKISDFTNPSDVFTATADFTKDLGEEQIIKKPIKKGITSKLIGKQKMKTPISKLFTITKEEIEKIKEESKEHLEEKWSKKYKDSINCSNPKGFSQRAHCQGKKKKSESNEATAAGSAGGFVGPVGFDPQSEFVKKSFE